MHEVEDISFGFVLPEPEPEAQALEQEAEPDASPAGVPAPPPAARPTPNTSAKRTRPDRSGSRSASTNHTARTTRSRSSAASSPLDAPARTSPTPRPDVYDISEHESSDGARQDSSSAAKRATSGRKSTTRKKQSGLSSGLRRVSLAVLEEDVEMATVPVPSSGSIGSAAKAPDGTLLQRRPQRSGSMAHSPIIREEVGESPADAPGSGRRRPLRLSEDAPVVGSSTLLQRVLEDLDETTAHVPSSSPLQRMVIRRQSGEAERQQRWSVRLSGGSTATGGDEDDELTPDRPRKRDIEVKKATFKPNGEKRARLEPTSAPVEKQPVEELERAAGDADEGDEGDEGEVEDEDTAQEIGDREAAQKLATRKRPRQSLPAPPSPELHSQPPESPEPAPKRRRRKEAASPARQQQPKQPKNKPGKKQAPANKKSGPKAKAKAPNTAADDGDEADGGSVPVTVHRFSKKPQVGEDEPDAGLLNAEIPFANRGGVNAVDVLSKLCEELIAAFLARLEDNVRNAEDAAGRREQRTMLRSLEAFQEELRTRLLEHVSCSVPFISSDFPCPSRH